MNALNQSIKIPELIILPVGIPMKGTDNIGTLSILAAAGGYREFVLSVHHLNYGGTVIYCF
jgi:hypothetical protein